MCNHLLKMKTSVLHIWMNTPKKSKSQTTCPHHFQLGCNNEWLAKNERWPICGRWKDLEESDVYDENRRVATMLEVANAKSCSWFNPKKG
ncbi:hypothetical protein ACFX13_031072 [Malus domestica]|uniref:Uncharacterized protein n=1 Tax=Malus domestica TaxID=3750 RepID=A0A498KBY0_MALDO|nr:hypothetical protein DVH24_003967 [Malus domestica]